MAFKIDLNKKDLKIDNNKHVEIADKDSDIEQRLTLKLDLMKGEWFLDTDLGVDYKAIFSLTGEEQLEFAKEEVRKSIETDKSVVEIKSIEARRNHLTETLELDLKVLCTDENEYTIKVRKGA